MLRLSTIGPPLAVAAASAALLVWFDKGWIPARQRYFNERNLRTLRTISTQIKTKVDSFPPALDHAIDSAFSSGGAAALKQYVKLFSQEQLEVVSVDPERPTITPDDPPNVRTQREDGKNYVYLAYKHEAEHRRGLPPVTLIARADIENVVAGLFGRSDFDAMLLVDSQGEALAQQSSSGLELTSIDALLERQPGAPQEKNHGDAFARLRGTTNLTRVTIGAAEYVLYAQPAQLSMRPDGDDKTARPPEEWTVCGLVRLERFRAASATIPTTYWLWCGAVLALICFAIPLLKLRVLSPRERFGRVDSASASVATFALMALAAVTILDLHVFGSAMPSAFDDQLRAVAESMSAHLHQEIQAIDAQMTAFRGEDAPGRTLWQQLDYQDEEYKTLEQIRRSLKADDKPPEVTLDAKAQHQWKCEPRWSCRSGVLAQLTDMPYPFFKIAGWSDDSGRQRVKWSTAPVVTPFINVNEAKFPYAEALRTARRAGGRPGIPSDGVSVLLSPSTGEKLTVFWKALPPLNDDDPTQPDLLGETLATLPISLTNPVLPKNLQFAVVDPTGRVLFHADAARSLTENFFQEAEDNPRLKSLVATRASGAASGQYLGRAHRFHVVPLDVSPFGDPRWSLVVFQEAAVGETANLQTIILTISMFAVYAGVLAAAWALFGIFRPAVLDRWFWPTSRKVSAFRRAAAVNVAAALGCSVALVAVGPAALVAVAALLIAGAFATTFALVRREAAAARPPSPSWMTDFLLARASLLFLLAAVPVMVCFHIAQTFHAELVVTRAQSQLAAQLDIRERRIAAQTKRMKLCDGFDRGVQPCDRVHSTVVRRAEATLWDVDLPVIEARAAVLDAVTVDSMPLRAFLTMAYRPYNDIAADLLMVMPAHGLGRWHVAIDDERLPLRRRRETFTERETRWGFVPVIAASPAAGVSLVVALGLMGIACLLVRYLMWPLFASELRTSTPLAAPEGAADDSSLLLIGPPGSPRTARLSRHPRVRVFDVRSLTFIDEPIGPPSTVDVAADWGPGADVHDTAWADAIRDASLNPETIVAVDRLEHRLDDQAFRERMLACLEPIVYGRDTAVWCSAVRDPIEYLDECQPSAPDRQRWVRLFEGFRREYLAITLDESRAASFAQSLSKTANLPTAVRDTIVAECRVAPELLVIGETLVARLPPAVPGTRTIALDAAAILVEIGRAAQPFYAALWSSCSADEKVVLRQVAEEGVVNPNSRAAVLELLRGGLVRRDRVFEVMNETFRRFVIAVVPHESILEWEHEGVRVPWGTIATTGLTVAFGLAGLLLLTQEQLVDAWISYVPALAPALPTAWKVLANVQKGRVDVPA